MAGLSKQLRVWGGPQMDDGRIGVSAIPRASRELGRRALREFRAKLGRSPMRTTDGSRNVRTTEYAIVSANTSAAMDEGGDGGPQRIGPYEIVCRLGEGGMAQVYLALAHAKFGEVKKLVVLKILHEWLRDEEHSVEMFVREASIAVQLTHPNIVTTFDVGSDDGYYYIVMEYLEGVSLARWIKATQGWTIEQRLPLLVVIVEALIGLAHVHEHCGYDGQPLQLVHRDVKPSNIFMTFDAQIKVFDFGIAKATGRDRDSTIGDSIKGTTKYMAPEHFLEPEQLDKRADVYAAGVTLFDIIMGQNPCLGMNDFEVIRCHLNGLPAGRLAETVPPSGFPPALFDIVKRATATDRSDRYADARELKVALARVLEELGVTIDSTALQRLLQKTFPRLQAVRRASIARRLESFESTRSRAASNAERPSHGLPVGLTEATTRMNIAPAVRRRRSVAPMVALGAACAACASAGVLLAMMRPPQPKLEAHAGFAMALRKWTVPSLPGLEASTTVSYGPLQSLPTFEPLQAVDPSSLANEPPVASKPESRGLDSRRSVGKRRDPIALNEGAPQQTTAEVLPERPDPVVDVKAEADGNRPSEVKKLFLTKKHSDSKPTVFLPTKK